MSRVEPVDPRVLLAMSQWPLTRYPRAGGIVLRITVLLLPM